MIRLSVPAAIALALATTGALAQAVPFDMNTERGDAPLSTPAPAAGSASVQGQPGTPAQPPALAIGPAEPAQPKPAAPVAQRRYLVPARTLMLAGETASRAWSVDLTAAEAASKTLHVGYDSAIVVAPETSRLVVSLNGTPVLDRPVRAAEGKQGIDVPVPAGLLHAGANDIRFATSLRHRTDCSVQSTFDLWARVDPARTYLGFSAPLGARYATLDDIQAVGVDAEGRTRFDVVVPALDQPAATSPLFRLTEGLAIHAGMPNQSVHIATELPTSTGPGELTVVVGTAAELARIVPHLPPAAAAAPFASFMPAADGGAAQLVISGPSWRDIDAAVDNIVAPIETVVAARDHLLTRAWRAPDAPVLRGGDSVSFADLGVQTTSDFSGRRYRTEFDFGIPSDFYASDYGKATILLDAAYSGAILPGSRINIYVNDKIASTYPISAKGGAILRHLPVQVTMRDFKPGLNVIALEAVLSTQSDLKCLPGANTDTTPRFALFDTSEFDVPRFARIAQRPNLAATSGTAFPYNQITTPLPLGLQSSDPAVLSAAATFLARLAVAAGKPIPVQPTTDLASLSDRSALFVGAIGSMQAALLDQFGISDTARSSWGDASGPASNEKTETREAFQAWRKQLKGGQWYGQISSLEDWLNRNFDISLAALRFVPKADDNFVPQRGSSLMIAQAANPAETATWTLVAAPTVTQLVAGVNDMTREDDWSRIGGHITTYDAKTHALAIQPVTTFSFVPTQVASFANYRLIAANWLSANTLSYAALVAIVSIVLGIATAGLLTRLGRKR